MDRLSDQSWEYNWSKIKTYNLFFPKTAITPSLLTALYNINNMIKRLPSPTSQAWYIMNKQGEALCVWHTWRECQTQKTTRFDQRLESSSSNYAPATSSEEAGSHSELFVKQNIMKVVVVEIKRVTGVLRAVLLKQGAFSFSVSPRSPSREASGSPPTHALRCLCKWL